MGSWVRKEGDRYPGVGRIGFCFGSRVCDIVAIRLSKHARSPS